MVLSTDTDLGIADGLESITLQRPGSSQVSVNGALKRAIHTAESAASGGTYTAADVAWHLPAAGTGLDPQPGDQILDAANSRWTVLEVRRETLSSRWRCHSRNLAIALGLDSHVTVQAATFQKEPEGALEPRWHDLRTGIPARIQPVRAEVVLEHGRRLTVPSFRIIIAEDLPLDHTHRVLGPDGSVYQVLGYERPRRIDDLPVILAEATPWPLGVAKDYVRRPPQ